ncbi:hypothetical protein TYRP_017518 [Tyrophagus putrescentiae]|nr:hypothetical protein TYRP_017518 [Tyrophagus putrescentiae]
MRHPERIAIECYRVGLASILVFEPSRSVNTAVWAIGLKLATINLSAWVELLLRPVLRLLRRTFPPSRWLYALMRLGNGGRWRQETRAEIFEELYRMVVQAAKGAEEERPAESYDSTVVYLPALKLYFHPSRSKSKTPKPMLLLLNRVLVPAALAVFLLLAMVRFSLKGEYGAGRLLRRLPGSENEVDSGSIGSHHWSRFARWAATRLNDALLRAFNWLLDGRHSVRELAGKEFAEFRQYWSRWLRWKLINGLVPTIRAPPTPSNNGAEGTARSVHFADQHEYLPEESRAEMGREGRRYRMVLRARVLNDNNKSPNDQNKEEIRILLNPCIDHLVITERAVAKLGLRRHAIWPRFQWGLYPRDDDMAVCTEVVTLQAAHSREITPTTVRPPPLPVRLELQVQARDFTGDRPLPLLLRKQLQREFSVQLSDGAPEDVSAAAAAAEDHPHRPRQLEHPVDVVVGADQLYSAFFSDREPDLVGIEIGLLRQMSTGFGAVFAAFEQPLDAKGRRAVEQKRAALEDLHQKMSFMDEMLK